MDRICRTCGEPEAAHPWEGLHRYGPTDHDFIPTPINDPHGYGRDRADYDDQVQSWLNRADGSTAP